MSRRRRHRYASLWSLLSSRLSPDGWAVLDNACRRNHWTYEEFIAEAFDAFLLFWAETFYLEETESKENPRSLPKC